VLWRNAKGIIRLKDSDYTLAGLFQVRVLVGELNEAQRNLLYKRVNETTRGSIHPRVVVYPDGT
jgi:hypothetical protein